MTAWCVRYRYDAQRHRRVKIVELIIEETEWTPEPGKLTWNAMVDIINPAFKHYLTHPQIAVSGVDQDDEIRIIEMPNHRFFLITLFVPQTRSKLESPHPLIRGFVKAVCSK